MMAHETACREGPKRGAEDCTERFHMFSKAQEVPETGPKIAQHIKILLPACQSVPTLVATFKFLVLNAFLKHADEMTGLPDVRR